MIPLIAIGIFIALAGILAAAAPLIMDKVLDFLHGSQALHEIIVGLPYLQLPDGSAFYVAPPSEEFWKDVWAGFYGDKTAPLLQGVSKVAGAVYDIMAQAPLFLKPGKKWRIRPCQLKPPTSPTIRK